MATAFRTQYDYKPIGETTQEYGLPEYQKALSQWGQSYGTYSDMLNEVRPKLTEQMGYYAPGGGYGGGQREEAKKSVEEGVGKDIGSMVASGMSSQAGARGLQTRAGAELSTLYKNIEDTRAQLWQQAIAPYSQLMQTMATVESARPTYGQYVKPVTTTQYGKVETGSTPYSYENLSEQWAREAKEKAAANK